MAIKVFLFYLFFSFLSNSDKNLCCKTNVFSYVFVGSMVVICQGRQGLMFRKESVEKASILY